MPKSNLKVVDRPTDERAELASKIAEHRALSERLAAAIAAGGWEKRVELKRNVELAEAALETAKADAAKYLTDQALGKNDDVAPTSIKDARSTLQDAKDELDVWQTVTASLQAEVKTLREEVADANLRLDSARMKVMSSSSEASAVYAQYKFLQRKLAGHRKLMEFLSGTGAVPDGWDVLHNPDDAEDTTAAIAEWQTSFESLRRDAAAPLPKV
jgi:hypothetical protein